MSRWCAASKNSDPCGKDNQSNKCLCIHGRAVLDSKPGHNVVLLVDWLIDALEADRDGNLCACLG